MQMVSTEKKATQNKERDEVQRKFHETGREALVKPRKTINDRKGVERAIQCRQTTKGSTRQ